MALKVSPQARFNIFNPGVEAQRLEALDQLGELGGNMAIGETLAGIGSAAKGLGSFLFGDSKDSQTSGTQRAFLEMTPEQRQRFLDLQNQLGSRTQSFINLLGQLQSEAQAPVPTLPGITVPSGPTALDALAKAQIAQGQQNIRAQEAAQNRRLSQQFRDRPGIARALQAQTRAGAIGAQTPLRFQAELTQSQRQIPQQQLQLAAEKADIQRALGQFGLGQQRRQELVGLGGQSLAALRQRLAAEEALANILGTRVAESNQKTEESGGLLGFLGL